MIALTDQKIHRKHIGEHTGYNTCFMKEHTFFIGWASFVEMYEFHGFEIFFPFPALVQATKYLKRPLILEYRVLCVCIFYFVNFFINGVFELKILITYFKFYLLGLYSLCFVGFAGSYISGCVLHRRWRRPTGLCESCGALQCSGQSSGELRFQWWQAVIF
jgi:hypothetical protein